MAVFVFSGRTRGGQTITGEMEAANREAVVARLRSQQVIATAVRGKPRDITIPGLATKVSEKEIVVFTRQFATMIDAGLPLVQCLEILASQQDNKTLKKTLTDIRQSVEGGSTFAAALKQHPKVFSSLYANMVEAGEAGGILDTILNRLAQYMEKAMALKKKVKSAMIYPSTIVTVAVVVVIFLLVFVIPTFKAMFEGFGAALPLPTQIVLELSRIVQNYIVVGIVAAVAAILGIRWWYGTPSGKTNIDRLLLRMPVMGVLIRKVA